MEFRLLGPLETRIGGVEVQLPPKQRAVLTALLLARDTVVSTDALVEALWDTPPRSARNQVQVYMSALRRRLSPSRRLDGDATPVVIETRRAGYRLRVPPTAVDLHHFEARVSAGERCALAGDPAGTAEQLRAALALWRGAPLSNVDGPLAATEAARLEERRLTVIERRVDADLALRRYAELVPELTALVAAYPLHEGLRRRLMLALYACGRGAQALAVYRDGRRALVTDLGIEPGPGLRKLEAAILRGEPVDASIGPPPLGRGTSTCQLPAACDTFTGREQLTRRLRDLLLTPRPAPPTVVVTGAPGIGKSALAVHVAHQLRSSFPDGVLYVDLRGSTATPVTPEVAMAELMGTLATTGSRPAGAATYRSLLADRRVLVVLDDAFDERQVRPLLPTSAGSAALVCGRGGLAALGGTRVPVPVLPPSDGVAMLAAVVGDPHVATDPAAAAVVAACEGVPLAIQIAGCRLAASPHRTVTWLAGRLAERRRRLAELKVGDLSVADAYAGTWTRLSATARDALTRASAEFTADSLAAQLAIPATTAESVIDELIDFHLVELTDDRGGYRMTALTRLYATL